MKQIILVGLLTLLVGCSSSPKKVSLLSDQYCHTSQVIEKDDDNVSSKTTVKCSDDPVEKYVPAKMGISKNCYETGIPMSRNGKLIYEKIIVCQKLSGAYDVVEPVRVR